MAEITYKGKTFEVDEDGVGDVDSGALPVGLIGELKQVVVGGDEADADAGGGTHRREQTKDEAEYEKKRGEPAHGQNTSKRTGDILSQKKLSRKETKN